MDDLAAVRMRHRRQRMRREVKRELGRHAARHAIGEGLDTQRHRDHEQVIDETRILNGEHIGVLHAHRQARLAAELVQEMIIHDARMGNLERHLDAMDCVIRLVHGRPWTIRQTPLDTVFAEFLSGPEQLVAGH